MTVLEKKEKSLQKPGQTHLNFFKDSLSEQIII